MGRLVLDVLMLSVRVSSPSELSHAVEALLAADPHVSSLTILRDASVQPKGDVFIADIPRERANPLVDSLRALGVHHEGTIALNPVETWISQPGLRRQPAHLDLHKFHDSCDATWCVRTSDGS
jgi:hypothetical protein